MDDDGTVLDRVATYWPLQVLDASFCRIDSGGKEQKTLLYSLTTGRMTRSWYLAKDFLSGLFWGVLIKAKVKGAVFAIHRWMVSFFTIESAVCVCLCLECLQLHSDKLSVSLCVCPDFFLVAVYVVMTYLSFCVFGSLAELFHSSWKWNKSCPLFMQ